MVSLAAFGTRDPGSNPDWFAVSKSNKKNECHELYKRVVILQVL